MFEALEARGTPRAWFARKMGITRAQLYNYERGLNRVPQGFIERACALLGIPPERITLNETPGGRYVQQPDEHRRRKPQGASNDHPTSHPSTPQPSTSDDSQRQRRGRGRPRGSRSTQTASNPASVGARAS
jgi:transcriptional regulator with XRE-family HTH domain